MTNLKLEYKRKKSEIRQRLKRFRDVFDSGDRDIFAELCFCILTPQSKAVVCDNAIKKLKRNRLLFHGSENEIRPYLKGVRFHNNKTSYILAARKNGFGLKNRLDLKDIIGTRDWLVKNIKGLGYKEASHFLRNIGLGKDISILDVHILRNLRRYRVIKDIPSSISRKTYFDIEKKMKQFSVKIGIPMEELDLVFWSSQTGFIFK